VIAANLDRIFRKTGDALDVIRDFQRRKLSLWLLDMGGDVSGYILAVYGWGSYLSAET
jgi:hypothetical protein